MLPTAHQWGCRRHGWLPLLLVANLAVQDVGVDLQHVAGDLARGPAELEDPEAVRLELPNSRGNTVAIPSTLLLRTAQNGTAEARRVDGRGGGTAATL